MIHPHTEIRFISEKIGYGVVATQFIPKGTITWALDKLDRIFTPEQIKSMSKFYKDVLDTYTYRNAEGNHILCWDNARFVNHSSNSNCITTAYEFELAVRDIHPGEELTDDYGYLNIEGPFEVIPEEGTDRHIIYPDDLIHHYNVWDTKLLEAFNLFSEVNQPLLHLIDPVLMKKINGITTGQEKMDSILNCYSGLKKLNGQLREIVKSPLPNVAYPF